MSVIAQIIKQAQCSPDKIAIQDKECAVSFAKFYQDIANAAGHLVNLNVRSSDNVVLHASNTYAFICSYFAVHLLAARCVVVDPKAEQAFLAFVLNKVQPRCELTSLDALLDVCEQPYSGANLATPDNIADIIFTSGTTGEPKGVALTHRQVLDATLHIVRQVGNNDTDRELLLMPLCHSFGLGRMRSTLYTGTVLVIGYPLNRLKQVFKAMEFHQITGLGIVPAAWEFIVSMSHDKLANYASQLKYIELGSAVFSPENKQKMRDWFPGTHLVMHYGLTEVSRAVFSRFHLDPDEAIGSLDTGADVLILDDNSNPVAKGTEGEIALKSDWMLTKYLDNPSLSQAAFAGSYFKTGDLGVIDNHHLYLRGRLKEIINVGGKKVNPSDIERVLSQHPAIFESACIPYPDPLMGEVVKAFVVCEAGEAITPQSMHAFLQDKLPTHMRPQHYERVTVLPKTSTGKIQRLKLVSRNK